jgi:hypothetical protein
VLTFCSHQEELIRIETDLKGLTGIEIVGVLGKDLEIICWFAALSRRRQGFDSPWDCHRILLGNQDVICRTRILIFFLVTLGVQIVTIKNS